MKIELIILVVLTVLVNSSIAQEKYDDGGPCRHWRPGDADLGTWDIISSYSSHGNWLETVTEIEGSNSLQTAYQLERGANLTMMAHEAFPRGTPFEFSFECTYRERQPQLDPWHLFHLTNSHDESQLSVTLNPGKKTLQVSLPDASGDLQMVEFRHSALFDQQWHKIMLGVTDDKATLWVDCQPVKSIQGYVEAPLKQRGQYDTHDGYLSIAQIANTRSYQSAPPIDLQWMVMTCLDPNRPLRQNCDEIPAYDVAGASPDFLEGPPPNTCKICPQGPAGFNGTDGRPGRAGERGAPGPMGIPGFSPPATKGEKGEQGMRGFDGRDGGSGRDGLPGLKGERGPPGLAGISGGSSAVSFREGQRGERGEIGLTGIAGPRGEMGYPGADGRAGVNGAKGEKGDLGMRGFDGQPGAPGPPGPAGEASESRSSGMGVHYLVGGGAGPRGEAGGSGPRGAPGPPGENGQPGRSFSEEDLRDICYNVLRGQLEELTAKLQGPPGPPGVGKRGVQGPQGVQGPTGEKGRQGFQGLSGLPGLPGPHGEQGYQGERGEKGEHGERGEEGVGRAGPAGPQGSPGVPGPDGLQGNPGRAGNAGEQGSTGNVGPRGPPGNPGQCPAECWQAMNQANALYYNRVQGNSKGP